MDAWVKTLTPNLNLAFLSECNIQLKCQLLRYMLCFYVSSYLFFQFCDFTKITLHHGYFSGSSAKICRAGVSHNTSMVFAYFYQVNFVNSA